MPWNGRCHNIDKISTLARRSAKKDRTHFQVWCDYVTQLIIIWQATGFLTFGIHNFKQQPSTVIIRFTNLVVAAQTFSGEQSSLHEIQCTLIGSALNISPTKAFKMDNKADQRF